MRCRRLSSAHRRERCFRRHAEADSELPSLPTCYSILSCLRVRFAAHLTAVVPELNMLLSSYLHDSPYLIEATTQMACSMNAIEVDAEDRR